MSQLRDDRKPGTCPTCKSSDLEEGTLHRQVSSAAGDWNVCGRTEIPYPVLFRVENILFICRLWK